MKTFGQLLKEYISKQGMTVYQLAKDIHMDRSFLQGVLSDNRKMPQKRFTDLLDSAAFTSSQMHQLCDAYFTEKFGEAEMERFRKIEYGLAGNYKKDLQTNPEVTPAPLTLATFYAGRSQVLSVIQGMIAEGTAQTFYSNFPFSDREINRIVYAACKRKQFLDFLHITAERDCANGSRIEAMFFALHYAEIGYLTDFSSENDFSCFFPYFIYTEKYFLQWDRHAEHAQLCSSAAVEPFISQVLENGKGASLGKILITENAIDYMEKTGVLALANNDSFISIDNTMCPAWLSPDIIQEIATPMIRSMPNVLDQLAIHYGNIATKSTFQKQIMTYQCLDRFVKTGRIEQFPLEYANPLSEQSRAQFLASTLAAEFELAVTNPACFAVNYPFVCQIGNQKQLFFISCADLPVSDTYLGKVLFTTEDEELVNDFSDYMDYLFSSEKTFSAADSRTLIQSYIERLRS